MREVAERLECSTQTISLDLRAVRAEWQSQAMKKMEEAVEAELAKIDQTEMEAWAAWMRSQGDAEKKTEGDGGKKRTARTQYGDAKFLEIVLRCVEQRCKLLGLDAAKRQEHKHGFLTAGEVRQRILSFERRQQSKGQSNGSGETNGN